MFPFRVHSPGHRLRAAYLINRPRPAIDTDQPTEAFVKATGKCAVCHTRLHYAVVHEYELNAHSKKGINCLDCRQQFEGNFRSLETHPKRCPCHKQQDGNVHCGG